MAFSSKGYSRQGDSKLDQLVASLRRASLNGRLPVLVDTSPCAQRMTESGVGSLGSNLYDLPSFINSFVIPRVNLTKVKGPVAVHVPCSLKNKSEEAQLLRVANLCAESVFVPHSAPCCGFAGDRGFSHPELTASALVSIRGEIPAECNEGYSTSRTCEIGVSLHSQVSYQSIAFLVDEAIQKVH
jgi:D-lactate dehydrogenase